MDCYEIAECLPKTSYGALFLGKVKESEERVAIKQIKLKQPLGVTGGKPKSRFKHPNIACLEDYFCQQNNMIFCVFQHAGHGDLLHHVQGTNPMPLSRAQHLFSQIVHGLMCFHKVGIAHRHVALENVLYMDKDVCQLCDFGVVTVRAHGQTDEGDFAKAPEIIAQQCYDPIVADMWALGVLLYTLLTGHNLFQRAERNDLRFQLLAARGVEALAQADNVILPSLVVALLDGMLTIEPTKRWTIQNVQSHQFLSSGRRKTKRRGSITTKLPELTVERPGTLRKQRRSVSAKDMSVVAKPNPSLKELGRHSTDQILTKPVREKKSKKKSAKFSLSNLLRREKKQVKEPIPLVREKTTDQPHRRHSLTQSLAT